MSTEEKSSERKSRRLKIKCPICKSEDVERKQAGSFGDEFYATYHCISCDHSDTVNEQKLEEWFGY